MVRIKPSVRSTETYTELNFLRVQTRRNEHDAVPTATIEHLCCRDGGVDVKTQTWTCQTIVDEESMSQADALFIAKAYAADNGIPVIYTSHHE
jgi:hypothetical protein